MADHPVVGFLSAAVLSLAAHGIAYASLAFMPERAAEPPPSRVSFRIHEPPPPEAEPAPPPVPPAPPPAPVRERVARQKPAATPETPPPAATAVDLRGVTLTNDTGGGWSSVVGNGQALDGPIAAVRRPAPPLPAPEPTRVTTPAAPAFVELADLSERPVPPDLGAVLARYYPADAKARGIGGTAMVRARIDADGAIRTITVMAESFAGFGDACRRTLSGSRWSAPKDRNGRAVATGIRYTCRFVVDR